MDGRRDCRRQSRDAHRRAGIAWRQGRFRQRGHPMILRTSHRPARVRRLGLFAAATVLVAGLLCGSSRTGVVPGLVLAQSVSETVVKPCPGRSSVLCGNIKVPLYWGAPQRRTLTVHFDDYLHTDPSLPALEPIVAMEGGPGYPSTGSAASYLFMIGSPRKRHDLIPMAQRGTGGSNGLHC